MTGLLGIEDAAHRATAWVEVMPCGLSRMTQPWTGSPFFVYPFSPSAVSFARALSVDSLPPSALTARGRKPVSAFKFASSSIVGGSQIALDAAI